MRRGIELTAAVMVLWFVAAAPGSAGTQGADAAVTSWQERRLMEPSESQLRQEEGGTVFIYDGMEHGTVQKAMDEHFERIENMMFTRIRHMPPSGSGPTLVEDDGCD